MTIEIKSEQDYDQVKKLGDWLSDEVGDNMEHVLFHVFYEVMDSMWAWEEVHVVQVLEDMSDEN